MDDEAFFLGVLGRLIKLMNDPLISVIIPTYNRPTFLERAIMSVTSQTYPNIELLVVSDGDPDSRTNEILKEYSPVRLIVQPHKGAGAARNTGLLHSSGEFIQFLDDDDWLDAEAIQCKYNELVRHEDIGCVFSDITIVTSNGKNLGTFYSRHTHTVPSGDVYGNLLARNFILVHAPLWRKEVLTRAGGFPERTGSEDWECLVKCAEFSQFFYLDKSLGYYWLHEENATRNIKRQVTGDGQVQSYIASSDLFQKLPETIQANFLYRYSFQQWLHGDVQLSDSFMSLARRKSFFNVNNFSCLVSRTIGRSLSLWLMRLSWKIRSFKSSSPGIFFLSKSEKHEFLNHNR